MMRRRQADPRSAPERGEALEPQAGVERARAVAPVAPEQDPLAPATSDELRAARRLAEALERGDEPLALALRAAACPADLDRADHEALLARALGDEGAPPTRVEQLAAERLRRALDRRAAAEVDPEPGGGAGGEGGAGARDELAELADALRAAWRPAPIAELRNRELVEQALRSRGGRRHLRVVPVTMAALSTLAAVAAGVAMMIGGAAQESLPAAHMERAAGAVAAAPASPRALIEARSTTALFDAAVPFPKVGGQTARIDRIAAARAADLRNNRYAAWGVR